MHKTTDREILRDLVAIDTVAAADGWVTDPFRLTEKDGVLYGLGACDMKGGIASALAAIAATDLKSLRRGIKVVWTYDEEIMFNGIKDYVNSGEPFAEGEGSCGRICAGGSMGDARWSGSSAGETLCETYLGDAVL